MKKINIYLIFIIDFFIRLIPRKKKAVYDVVIVRSDAIGDFVIFISVLQAMRQKWKNQKLLLICPSQNKSLAEKMKLTDDVVYFDKEKMETRFFYHGRFIWSIKNIYAKEVINPTICHHLTDDLISSVIQADKTIGTKVEKKGLLNNLCDRYFTDLIEIPNNINEMKSIEYFTQITVDKNFKYTLSDLNPIYSGYTPIVNDPYCVIALSASVKGRIWPKEKVSKVINNIPAKYTIILTGYGDLDMEMAQYITKHFAEKERLINVVNKTSLIDLVCIISKAYLVMGNDSASIHIAASCRVRSICYTPGAHFGRFVPYPNDIPEKEYHPICINHDMGCNGCNYNCKYVNPMEETLPCLNAIEIDDVITQMKKTL